MMNSRLSHLLLVVILCSATQAWAEQDEKKGRIKLQEDVAFGEQETIEAGETVKFEVNAYIDEFFDTPIINANAKIVNTTDKHMNVSYLIMFFNDGNEVMGAHGMNWTLEPNEDLNFGSALIKGKLEKFRTVTHYRLITAAYETVKDD